MREARKQLSMYVPIHSAIGIEDVRKILDPIQSRLIPAHITLCREDELSDLSNMKNRLANIPFRPLTLSFAKLEAFSGHGWLLNCISSEDDFHSLREYLMSSKNIRHQKPHITLAHPRNPKSAGNTVKNASTLPEMIRLTFPAVYLIEQMGSEPWRVLERYELLG